MKPGIIRLARANFFAMLAVSVVSTLTLGSARAEERHGPREARGHDRGHEVYRSQHWVFDNRHHLGHYYPVMGYSVAVLPAGNITIGFGSRRLFFNAGVWYEPGRSGYAVIRPPVGIVVPILPPAYATVWAGSAPYYYANEVYYTQVADGYAVVEPPATVAEASPPVSAPPPPSSRPPAPATSAPPAAVWYWCESERGYYPYVPECKTGWKQVPAKPPGTP